MGRNAATYLIIALLVTSVGCRENAPAVQDPVSSAEYKLVEVDAPSRTTDYVLALLAADCKRGPNSGDPLGDPDDLVCAGRVKNISAKPVDTAMVVVRLFDSRNAQVGRDGVRIMTLPLPPDEVSSFELVYYYAPKSAVSWSFAFTTFYDEPLPTRDDR